MDLSALNPQQQKAVLHTEGPLLILAGAGSGKTRVLTHRVAYLIGEKGVAPHRILAITFTNKAANEMKTRIRQMVQHGDDVWVSTFHSFCVRILRREAHHIGFANSFTIYDEKDAIDALGQSMKALHIDEKYFPVKVVKSIISDSKNHGKNATVYAKEVAHDFRLQQVAKIFTDYEIRLKKNNALDFDDLIMKTLQLFMLHPQILEKYAKQFLYIHIDEYQDTNYSQYELVRMLASVHGNLCVVGDDDQSIYAWRGADVRNILEFEKDFSSTTVIRLEQNYRSTQIILDAANAVIAHNVGRKKKKLWTKKEGGAKIAERRLYSEQEEAQFITEEIMRLQRFEGYAYGDLAILYRMNAQSRVLENALLRYGIPFKVYGGQRFYERKEIKDALAYLRLIVNHTDDVCLLRIINVPKRGIGDVAIEEITRAATARGESLASFILDIHSAEDISPRVKAKLKDFSKLLQKLFALKEVMPLYEFVQFVLEESGYLQQYRMQDNEEAISRLENIEELMGAVQEYVSTYGAEMRLEDYLDSVALISDIDAMQEERGAVSLMTMHSAKGLEFPVVFIPGMEEGVFPSARSVGEGNLEEERRLCYVAITRARNQLYLLSTQRRMLFNAPNANPPSRFLQEIPQELMDKPQRPQAEQPQSRGYSFSFQEDHKKHAPKYESLFEPEADIDETETHLFRMGDKVLHATFGKGTVIAAEGKAGAQMLKIAFEGLGIKVISAAIAPIKPE